MLEGLIPWVAVFGFVSFTGAAAACSLCENKRRGVLRRALPLAVGLAFLPGFVAAQPGDSLLVKVRWERGGLLTGRGFVTRPDTLTFLPEGRADTLMLAFDSIRELRVRRGDQSHFWPGLCIGAGVGALLGTIAGYIDGDDSADPNSIINLAATAEMKAAAGAQFGGVLGAVTGGIIGGSVRTPRFVRIGTLDLHLEMRGGADESRRAPMAP